MTISTTSNTAIVQGNGLTTSFDFTFPVPTAQELFVYYTNTAGVTGLLPSSSYTVTGVGTANGGSVGYPISGSPIPSGSYLTIQRVLPVVQLTDLVNQSGFYPNVVENALDYLTMLIQQAIQASALSLQVPVSSGTPNLVYPATAARALQLAGFDANGNAAVYPVTASVGAGDMRDDVFVSGTNFTPGTTTTLTLSRAPSSIANMWVAFDGVWQGRDQILSLNGATLIFTSPIPVGTQEVFVKSGTTLSINQPAAGSVGPLQFAPAYGPTSARPVPQQIGQRYTDQTLGYDVVCTSVVPPVWENVSGSPPIAVNALKFGADPTGATDSSAAFAAAVASCSGSAIEVYFPAGTYYFASAPVVNMTSSQASPSSISIRGAGSGVTRFKFSGGGFTVTYGSAYTSVHVEGISFLAPAVGGNSALSLIQDATFATGFGQYGLTTLRDLEFRGDDGFNEAHYWGTGISVQGASNINFYDCTFYGPTGTPSGAGIDFGYALNDHSIIPVVYNVMGCSFTHLQSGVIYGGNCQGLSVLYSNFTANFVGIIVPSSSFATDQLLVNSSQFNNINDSILCQVWCQSVSITNCLFLVSNNSVGVNIQQAANTAIVGNIFGPTVPSPINEQGVQIGTYSQGASVITGNQFNGLTIAVALLSGSTLVNVQSNCYQGNGTNVNNGGSGNTVGGGSA